jgi:SNF2 family DNA or RNA helicase
VRIIISGTPVQNNLAELHSLMDFAVPGLLGAHKEFKVLCRTAGLGSSQLDTADQR